MNFWKTRDPNGALSEFRSVEIEELEEMNNFRALAEDRMSLESCRKRRSLAGVLWISQWRREREERNVRERERGL